LSDDNALLALVKPEIIMSSKLTIKNMIQLTMQ